MANGSGSGSGSEAPALSLVGASTRPAAGRQRRKRRGKVREPDSVDWYVELVRESDLEPQSMREMLAGLAVQLKKTVEQLGTKRDTEGLNGEEGRALVGAASNLRRVLEQLGARSPKDDDEDATNPADL